MTMIRPEIEELERLGPLPGSRQSRWGWSDVRGCRRVGAGAARPRRDDGRCL